MFVPKTPLGRGLALSALVGVGGLGWTSYRLLFAQPVRARYSQICKISIARFTSHLPSLFPSSQQPQVWEKHVVPHGPLVPLAGNLWQVLLATRVSCRVRQPACQPQARLCGTGMSTGDRSSGVQVRRGDEEHGRLSPSSLRRNSRRQHRATGCCPHLCCQLHND